MKKLVFTLFLAVCSLISFSQSDTLYTAKKKIPCKIYEINEFEIKYRMASALDGPVYVIDKSTVKKYTLSNGFTEMLMRDEMSLEHEHGDIMNNRQVIKIHPFSFAFNHASVSYEKVIKVGMNMDVEVGYINSSINDQYNLNGYSRVFHSGAYIKPGVKFFLGQDFSIKGLKYAHPLKGRYIKLDVAASYINYQNLEAVEWTNWSTPSRTVTSNMNAFSYGAFVNYGRQFILGNILTMDYYVGVGFTGLSYSYSNPEFSNLNNLYYYRDYAPANLFNFYGFYRTPSFGISFTAGFRIGYILPEGKQKGKQKTPAIN
ncbi:MAG: hypothetical protein K0S32_2879 [Bacteroidetes bacterium]|nr:hypothetical protein [Bacteroidota bacterium]